MKFASYIVAAWSLNFPAMAFVTFPVHNLQRTPVCRYKWLETHTTHPTISATPSTEVSGFLRRKLLGGSITTVAAGILGGGGASSEGAVSTTDSPVQGSIKPLVDTPLQRLQLPKGGVGRDYVIVPLSFRGSDKVLKIL